MSLVVKIKKKFESFSLDVDFTINSKNASLLGASGSGKSLTMKCIAGLIKPDSGYIELNGRVLFDSENKINIPPQNRKVGYMFQNYKLFPNMNVEKNILMALNHVKDKKAKADLIDKYLNMFNIKHLENKYPDQLSGGEAQRVALARIIASEPEILLFDEPFSALDEFNRSKVMMETKKFIDEYSYQSILVTHNYDEAFILSQYTILLSNGNIIVHEEIKNIYENPKKVEVAILTGCQNYSKISRNNDSLLLEGWGIEVKKEVKETTKFLALRDTSFSFKGANKYPIKVEEILESSSSKIILFRFINQKENTPSIIYKIDKETKIDKNIEHISFKIEDLLELE